mgnify:CR=1 FL=1
MRPLDPLTSIKAKLGLVIVAAVLVTVITLSLGFRAGLPGWLSAIGAAILAADGNFYDELGPKDSASWGLSILGAAEAP